MMLVSAPTGTACCAFVVLLGPSCTPFLLAMNTLFQSPGGQDQGKRNCTKSNRKPDSASCQIHAVHCGPGAQPSHPSFRFPSSLFQPTSPPPVLQIFTILPFGYSTLSESAVAKIVIPGGTNQRRPQRTDSVSPATSHQSSSHPPALIYHNAYGIHFCG